MMHGPWQVTDEQGEQVEQPQFLDDLASAGAAPIVFAFFATTSDLGLTRTEPLLTGWSE